MFKKIVTTIASLVILSTLSLTTVKAETLFWSAQNIGICSNANYGDNCPIIPITPLDLFYFNGYIHLTNLTLGDIYQFRTSTSTIFDTIVQPDRIEIILNNGFVDYSNPNDPTSAPSSIYKSGDFSLDFVALTSDLWIKAYGVCFYSTNCTLGPTSLWNMSPPPPIDVCPNIAGDQAVPPDGYVFDSSGNCVPTSPFDACPNLPDIQPSVPYPYVLDSNGNCVIPPTPPPFDACPNLPDIQPSVPYPYTVDSNGNCVTPSPKIANDCKNYLWKSFVLPQSFKSQGDCISYVEAHTTK